MEADVEASIEEESSSLNAFMRNAIQQRIKLLAVKVDGLCGKIEIESDRLSRTLLLTFS